MDSQVTIVIPCFNHAEYLGEAIQSAKDQTVPVDIIVVDDGSTDNSFDVARKFKLHVLISKENGGLSSARNAGIDAANTEWVLPLDSDDKIDPTFVEKCLKVSADVIGTGQETFGDYVQKHIFKPEPNYANFRESNQMNCCSMFRKSMWKELGGYDEQMRDGYEDWDFWLRASKAGYKFKTIPEVLFYYRKHGKSMIDETVKKHALIKQYMLSKLDK